MKKKTGRRRQEGDRKEETGRRQEEEDRKKKTGLVYYLAT